MDGDMVVLTGLAVRAAAFLGVSMFFPGFHSHGKLQNR
jgi:hypothetical protein